MLQLQLSADQARVLHEILEDFLGDLRMEIAGTDRFEFREGLKRREEFVKDLLVRLSEKAV